MANRKSDLGVTLAGVHFPNPIGVGAVGAHWGNHMADLDLNVQMDVDILIKHVKAGAGHIDIPGMYLTDETVKLVYERSAPPKERRKAPMGTRMLKAEAAEPYGVEGFYFVPSPFLMNEQFAKHNLEYFELLYKKIIEQKPKDVKIIANVGGIGDTAESWVDGAIKFEAMGADLIELNVSCPIASGVGGMVDAYFDKKYPPLMSGMTVGDREELVEEIVRKVVNAVNIPVGIKLSPETGFPRIIGMAKSIRDAGAKFIHLFNAGVGLAPPDIYNQGKPQWLYMDGSPFCMVSGSFLRIPCYRDIAAIKKFVPELDIIAAGGLVEPKHFIEAMMLGATLVQPCTGVIEQGRSLLRKSVSFMDSFVENENYNSLSEVIGLGQQYIKDNEDIDMMPGQTTIQIDHDKCIRCMRCVDNICKALYAEKGVVKVHEERCAGCGGCTIACQSDALKVVLK